MKSIPNSIAALAVTNSAAQGMASRLYERNPSKTLRTLILAMAMAMTLTTAVVAGGYGGIPGDFNGDGVLDLADMDLLSAAVVPGSNQVEFDLNGDSVVNVSDIEFWLHDLFGTWFGDANLDGEFDSVDLILMLSGGLYETGLTASWASGDWNGNGFCNSDDLVLALWDGGYEQGPAVNSPGGGPTPLLAILNSGGIIGDAQTSLVYDAETGELSIDAPPGSSLTGIIIHSAAGLFTGPRPDVLSGVFDLYSPDKLFKGVFGESFGSISFGPVLAPGSSEASLLSDLTVMGSLSGGGGLGDVDLVYTVHPTDSDGDGVADEVDDHPDSDLREHVWIGACGSGVSNDFGEQPVNEAGSSLADEITELLMQAADGARNHGQFVSRMARVLNVYVYDGTITWEEHAALMVCVGSADRRQF